MLEPAGTEYGSDDAISAALAAELLGVDCCNGADGTLLGDDVKVSTGKPMWVVVTGDIRSLNVGAKEVTQEISSVAATGWPAPFLVIVDADGGWMTFAAVDVSPVGPTPPGLVLRVTAGCVFIHSRTLSTP